MLSFLITLAVASCNSSEDKPADAKPGETASQPDHTARKPEKPAQPERAPEPEKPAIPPLSAIDLGQIERMVALVRIPGQPDRQGVLLNGGTSDEGRRFLVICEAPPDMGEIAVAFPTGGKFGTAFAKRIAVLPSGLSVYRFQPKLSISAIQLREPAAGETFHSIRLAEEGEESADQKAAVEQQLAEVREKISETRGKEAGLLRDGARPRGASQNRNPSNSIWELRNLRREIAELEGRENQIKSQQIFPAMKVKATELAAANGRDGFDGKMENALLVSSGKSVVAIRSGVKWVEIKDIVDASAGKILEATLSLTGQSRGLSLICWLRPVLPYGDHGFSMVAASTFELESQGSGSVEERLASLERIPIEGPPENLSFRREIAWNGQPSNLWIRVFSDKQPDRPVLDEVIRISYGDSFSARWGKPPSPLITIPEAEPNQPEDLVSEKGAIDAKGEILDLVAPGDGAVVMVRTDAAPYWAPFDLNTGKWLPVKWKATGNTLLAAQAGKLYLLDRATRVLEIRNLATGEREGLQILSFEGSALAFAAPLSNPDKPVMIATDKGAYLFDPVRFEPVASGMDLRRYFDKESKNSDYTLLDSATVRVRVSDDGSLYSLQGTTVGGTQERSRPIGVTTVLDASSIAVASFNDTLNVASRGRSRVQGFPDHGGSGLVLASVAMNSPFPGPAGKIQFQDSGTRQQLAELADLPLLPPSPGKGAGKLADDRGCYFDSKARALLVPDGSTLHFYKLKLPEIAGGMPVFVMAGEEVEIPLQPGTGHTLTSSGGGAAVIEGQVMRWTAPLTKDKSFMKLELEWQGELGSRMDAEYSIQVMPRVGLAEAVSADGKKRMTLRLRGILPDVERTLKGFAGAGNVAFTKDFDTLGVYNLSTCELLHKSEVEAQTVLGDADHLYLVEPGKKITSLDIATGRVLAEKDLSSEIRSIATGMGSRLPLLAVEQQGVRGMLLMINPDTLDSRLVELNDELKERFFMPDLASNASGSAMWTRGIAIYRDGKAITMRTFPTENTHMIMDAAPDATGKLIMDRHSVYDIGGSSPVATRVPGTENGHWVVALDLSGRYLMLAPVHVSTDNPHVSVRTLKAPDKELFRIQADSRILDNFPWLISGTGTLVCRQQFGGTEKHLVYDFDVPAIHAELSR